MAYDVLAFLYFGYAPHLYRGEFLITHFSYRLYEALVECNAFQFHPRIHFEYSLFIRMVYKHEQGAWGGKTPPKSIINSNALVSSIWNWENFSSRTRYCSSSSPAFLPW